MALAKFFDESVRFCICIKEGPTRYPGIHLEGSPVTTTPRTSELFGIHYRKALEPGNLTEDSICGDEMIHQLLILKFRRHREVRSFPRMQTRTCNAPPAIRRIEFFAQQFNATASVFGLRRPWKQAITTIRVSVMRKNIP